MEKQPQPNHQEIEDLVRVGSNPDNATFHRPDGKFLSSHELGLIEENQDLIRDNLPAEVAEPEPSTEEDKWSSPNHPSTNTIDTIDDLPEYIESDEPTAFDVKTDADSTLADAAEHKPGRSKFDRAREIDRARKSQKKAEIDAKIGVAQHERRVKVVADGVDVLEKQKLDPDYAATAEEKVALTALYDLEQHHKKMGLTPLTELVSQDDIRMYKYQKEQELAATPEPLPAPESPAGPEEPPTIEQPLPDPSELARELARDAIDIDLAQDLGNAVERYTALLAKHDTSVIGRRKQRAELESARTEYESLRAQANKQIADFLEAKGFDSSVVQSEIMRQDIGNNGSRKGELGLIRDRSEAEAMRIGKESRFVSWWANQRGKKGFLLKGAVMAPVGIAAGAAAGVVLGPVGGAVAAGFIARNVAKNYMRSKLEAKAGASTKAHEFATKRHSEQLTTIIDQQSANTSGKWHAESVTSEFSEDSEKHVRRNRRRLIGGVAIGAAAGVAGGLLADKVGDWVGGRTPAAVAETPGGGSGPAPTDLQYERTHGGELFGFEDKNIRLYHGRPGDGEDMSVWLGDAEGNPIVDNLELGENGLTAESVAKLEAAGYNVELDATGDSGNGTMKILENVGQTGDVGEMTEGQIGRADAFLGQLAQNPGLYDSLRVADQMRIEEYMKSMIEPVSGDSEAVAALKESVDTMLTGVNNYSELTPDQWMRIQEEIERLANTN